MISQEFCRSGIFLGDYFSCKEVEENIKSVALI